MLQLFIYLFLIYNCNAFYILFQPNIAKFNILMLDNVEAKQKWLNSLNDEPSWLKNKQTNNTKENYLENINLNILEAKNLIVAVNNKILEAESNINYLLKH